MTKPHWIMNIMELRTAGCFPSSRMAVRRAAITVVSGLEAVYPCGPFDAIHVVNGVAVVDKEACKACGKCVEVCPKHLISLIPYDAKYTVACSSEDKGPVTMKDCEVGCIGCSLCKKNCPPGCGYDQ